MTPFEFILLSKVTAAKVGKLPLGEYRRMLCTQEKKRNSLSEGPSVLEATEIFPRYLFEEAPDIISTA